MVATVSGRPVTVSVIAVLTMLAGAALLTASIAVDIGDPTSWLLPAAGVASIGVATGLLLIRNWALDAAVVLYCVNIAVACQSLATELSVGSPRPSPIPVVTNLSLVAAGVWAAVSLIRCAPAFQPAGRRLTRVLP